MHPLRDRRQYYSIQAKIVSIGYGDSSEHERTLVTFASLIKLWYRAVPCRLKEMKLLTIGWPFEII